MAKVNYPVFYLWIYSKIRKKTKGLGIIPHPLLFEILKRSIPWTPHHLYYPIIEDLEKYKLIKKINKKRLYRRNYEIIGKNADVLLNQYNLPI